MPEIKLYGLPRSGGTVVYNIVKELFPKKKILPQTHSYFKDGDKIVVTYRDFRDCALSAWRVGKKFDSEENISLASFESLYKYIVGVKENIYYHLNSFKNDNCKREILFLKYEEWIEDYNFLFNELEKFFKITIENEKRNLIREKFSISNTKKLQKGYSSFKFYDKKTHFHGFHVFTGKPGTWRDLIMDRDKEILNYSLKEELGEWGYFKGESISNQHSFLKIRFQINNLFYKIFSKNLNIIFRLFKKL